MKIAIFDAEDRPVNVIVGEEKALKRFTDVHSFAVLDGTKWAGAEAAFELPNYKEVAKEVTSKKAKKRRVDTAAVPV